MFNRLHDILLQREYQAKTKELRENCESIGSNLSDFKQEINKLEDKNIYLREKNNELVTNNNFLAMEILAQSETISRNKQEFNDYKNEETKLIDTKNKIEKNISDINILLLEIRKKYDEETKKLELVKNNIKEGKIFFDKLQEKMNENLVKISEQEKFLKTEDEKDRTKKEELRNKEIFLNEKALNNRQEDVRLGIYRERLNIHYRNLGLNIKL